MISNVIFFCFTFVSLPLPKREAEIKYKKTPTAGALRNPPTKPTPNHPTSFNKTDGRQHSELAFFGLDRQPGIYRSSTLSFILRQPVYPFLRGGEDLRVRSTNLFYLCLAGAECKVEELRGGTSRGFKEAKPTNPHQFRIDSGHCEAIATL